MGREGRTGGDLNFRLKSKSTTCFLRCQRPSRLSIWMLDPLFIIRRLADDLVAIRELSLESCEIPDSACAFDLEHRVVDRCVDLFIS